MNFPSHIFFNNINHGYRAAILKKNSLWLLPFYMLWLLISIMKVCAERYTLQLYETLLIKQFFCSTWFYQGSTKTSFFRSFENQKKVTFLRVGFMWLLLNHVKNLLPVICNSKTTVFCRKHKSMEFYRQYSFQCQSLHIRRTYQINLY